MSPHEDFHVGSGGRGSDCEPIWGLEIDDIHWIHIAAFLKNTVLLQHYIASAAFPHRFFSFRNRRRWLTFREGSLRCGNKTFEAPGDIMAGNPLWVRYEDDKQREFKLNVERNNGRAASIVFVRVVSDCEL